MPGSDRVEGQRVPGCNARAGAPERGELDRRSLARARLLPRDADARDAQAAHEQGVFHDPPQPAVVALEAALGQETLEALLADGGARLEAQCHAPRIVRRVGTLI